MLIHADINELLHLAKDFYHVSNTILAIYDAKMHNICSFPDTMCRFCTEVRNSPALTEKCFACDRVALERCAQTHSTYVYQCHMGLIEVATPIMQNNIVIGYMLFGQIAGHKDKHDILKDLADKAERYNLNYAVLQESVAHIPYRSPEYIDSLSRMMEMCTKHVWQNGLMRMKNDTIAHIIDLYIHDNLDQKLNVDVLCDAFHISRSTLYELSKKHFGCGISDYIASCRIHEARKLLRTGEQSVLEISNLLGMDNVSYFIRFFKKYTGVTPKKYRTQWSE